MQATRFSPISSYSEPDRCQPFRRQGTADLSGVSVPVQIFSIRLFTYNLPGSAAFITDCVSQKCVFDSCFREIFPRTA